MTAKYSYTYICYRLMNSVDIYYTLKGFQKNETRNTSNSLLLKATFIQAPNLDLPGVDPVSKIYGYLKLTKFRLL